MELDKSRGSFDIVLEVEDERFSCYKELLCHGSDYFKVMFGGNFVEASKSCVTMHEVDSYAMSAILKWCQFKKKITFEDFNHTCELLLTSRMLQFIHIEDICLQEILSKRLSLHHYVELMYLSDALCLIDLHRQSKSMALWEFSNIKKLPEFLNLNLEKIVDYLSQDGLNTKSELDVFESIIAWVQEDSTTREQYIPVLTKLIRFKDIISSDVRSMLYYYEISENEEMKKIMECIADLKDNYKIDPDQKLFIDQIDSNIQIDSSFPCKICNGNCCTSKKYTCYSVYVAISLMNKKSRSIPASPCFVGYHKNIPAFIWLKNCLLPPIVLTRLPSRNANENAPIGPRSINIGFDIYFSGGEYSMGYNNWNDMIWKYDFWKHSWSFESKLNSPRRHHSLCVIDDDIYFIGGVAKNRCLLDLVEKYNIVTKQWTRCCPYPGYVYSIACCNFKGRIFSFENKLCFYNPSLNGWFLHEKAPKKFLPIGPSCAMADDKYIYLTGIYSKQLYRFNPDEQSDEYELLGEFHQEASNSCLVSGKIYAFSESFDTLVIEEYDIATGVFTLLWTKPPKLSSQDGITNIYSRHSIGCFPFVYYF